MNVEIPAHDPIENGSELFKRLLPVIYQMVTSYPDEQQRHDALQGFLIGAVALAVSQLGEKRAADMFALMSSASVALAKKLSGETPEVPHAPR